MKVSFTRRFPVIAAGLFLAWLALLLAELPVGLGAQEASPGTITLSSTAITGQQGKALIAMIWEEEVVAARACAFIDASPYTMPPTVMTDLTGEGGPCDGTTPETVFPPGSYTLTVGIYTPPAQEPDKSIEVDVQVDGDVAVVLDGTALSAGASGDVDCNEGVDSVDALFVLRRVANLQPFADCIDAGDVDCDEDVDSVDALGILRHVAHLPPLSTPSGCPAIGA